MPTSRLALKYRNRFADPVVRNRLRMAFGSRGVTSDRLLFLPSELHYLEAYNAIDIALDPFPFSGVTTTFDALTMGVPVIARAGETAMWRMSASILTAAGLEGLTAPSEQAFVATAVGLAADLARLDALRAGLRGHVAQSPLCDGPAFARSLESLWRDLWRRWCGNAPAC
jgi:predicted O-linked N-acetylglucosamine transferase (SPINDLY family)